MTQTQNLFMCVLKKKKEKRALTKKKREKQREREHGLKIAGLQ